jgi:hypothetical protein
VFRVYCIEGSRGFSRSRKGVWLLVGVASRESSGSRVSKISILRVSNPPSIYQYLPDNPEKQHAAEDVEVVGEGPPVPH